METTSNRIISPLKPCTLTKEQIAENKIRNKEFVALCDKFLEELRDPNYHISGWVEEE